ncbi:MAG: DUF5677 domain-containing protein [Planctomycetota bacterium]|nr:DUF5677 domain-containing protein [Planctomycetota bacterium]
MTDEESHVALPASYCLLSCYDYLASAFDAFKNGRFHAGLACCRPVAETAIIFLWCVQECDEGARARFERWMKATLLENKRFIKGLSETSVFRQHSKSHSLEDSLEQTREMLNQVSSRKSLPGIKQMLESMDKCLKTEEVKATDLYTMLYLFLCSGAHAEFAPERYFRLEGDIFKRVDRVEMPHTTPWVALTSAYYMAVTVFMFFGWDYAHLKAEYQEWLAEEVSQ